MPSASKLALSAPGKEPACYRWSTAAMAPLTARREARRKCLGPDTVLLRESASASDAHEWPDR